MIAYHEEVLEGGMLGRLRDVREGKVHCKLLVLGEHGATVVQIGTELRHGLLFIPKLIKTSRVNSLSEP